MKAINRKWFGDRLWFLTEVETSLLKETFSERNWEGLRSKRKKYRKLIRDGEVARPPRPSWYKLGMTPQAIRAKLDEIEKEASPEKIDKIIVDTEARELLHQQLDEALDNANINPQNVEGFSMTIGEHTGYIKDSNNEIEYTDPLRKKAITLRVNPRKFVPDWNPIHPPIEKIEIPKTQSKPSKTKGIKTCVVLPDPQIGYRKFIDGTTDPFHDESAISIALQAVIDLKPDKVVLLGDIIDVPAFGRYEQTEDFAHTTQMAIYYTYRMLSLIRSIVPHAEIVVIEGNHDRRIEKSIRVNTMFAYNIHRADDAQKLPVMSVPNLLAFDSLNIKYIEGYPAGKYWINENLQCIHGHIVRQAGATAPAVVKSETVSTIFGHIHRIETAYDTQNVYGGARANLAHSPGALCRIDGGVPSVKGSIGLDGRPIQNYENWQQGFAIVDYEDGNGSFSLHSVYINTHQGYKTTINNKLYLPNKKIMAELNKDNNLAFK